MIDIKRNLILFSILIISCILTNTASAENQVFSWYCKRNSKHNQPVLDQQMVDFQNYDLFWCDQNHKNMSDDEKVIYLTFDAGYENGNIWKILEILEKENVNVTFFILDNLINKNKDIVNKMINDGHLVANHTMRHKDMTKIQSKDDFKKELEDLENLYKDTFNQEMPKFYRPPEGKFNLNNLVWAKELGYKTVMWSFAYADWDNGKQPSHEYAINKIMENIHNGEVMLLHPTSKTNAEILPQIIRNLKEQGFRFGTVDELCKK